MLAVGTKRYFKNSKQIGMREKVTAENVFSMGRVDG